MRWGARGARARQLAESARDEVDQVRLRERCGCRGGGVKRLLLLLLLQMLLLRRSMLQLLQQRSCQRLLAGRHQRLWRLPGRQLLLRRQQRQRRQLLRCDSRARLPKPRRLRRTESGGLRRCRDRGVLLLAQRPAKQVKGSVGADRRLGSRARADV
jgi:hypothetical protein